MSKDTMLRTKQAEVIRDLKSVSAELNSIKGIITSGVVSSEILKADEALHENLDKLHTLCDFIIEFYDSLDPASIVGMKKDLLQLREKNAESQGTIFDLKKQIADLRQESLENKTKIEKADAAIEAFKDPQGLAKSMEVFYNTIIENEDLARDFFELDDISEGDNLHKKVAYSVKLLDKVLIDGIDFAQKLKDKFNEYNLEIGTAIRRATDEKSRADKLAEDLKTRIASLEQMQKDYEKEQKDKEALQEKEQELTGKLSELNEELAKEKENSESLSNQLQSEIESREMAENYLERLGIAYETLRNVVPSEVMAAIDNELKSNDEGAEDIVQELLLGAIVSKEDLANARNKYGTLKDAFEAVLGKELLAEYEGLTEEQNPYLWFMQTHQDIFVEKAKSEEQLEKAAADLENAVQEQIAVEQGVVHTISLLAEDPDIEKIKENAIGYLKEKIEEIKQESANYKRKAGELEGQVKEKEDELSRLREYHAGKEADNAEEIRRMNQKIRELESEKKAMAEEFEEPEISSNALLLKADMQYMLAKDYLNENAMDTAKIYFNAAINFCNQAFEGSDEEGKEQIQEKMKEYRDTLKILEEQ